MASPISVKSALSFGWSTFKARPWIFVGTVLVYLAVQFVLGLVGSVVPQALAFIISVAVGTLLAAGFMTFYIRAHDNLATASLKDLWNPQIALPYFATSLVTSFAVGVGLLLLVVPGVILALAFSMAPYLVIENRAWGIKALKQSWHMTKGNWVNLVLIGAVLLVINFVGALFLLMLGLFVTIPVSMLAMAHVYRTLSGSVSTPEISEATETEAPSDTHEAVPAGV